MNTYPTEIVIVAWGCVLALVHIFITIIAKTRQYGSEWNMSARDGDTPPPSTTVARLERAQANYFETFPLAVTAGLALVIVGRNSTITEIGAIVWLSARVIYLPLYWAGVPKLRTLVFLVSTGGLGAMLWPLLIA